ncbi:hypothetical protein JCM11641_003212 [Rhodosporidiobolus odoratus]
MSVASPRDSSLRPLRFGRIPSSGSTSSSLATTDSLAASNNVSIVSSAPSSIDLVDITSKESQDEFPAPTLSLAASPISCKASPPSVPVPHVYWHVGRDFNSTTYPLPLIPPLPHLAIFFFFHSSRRNLLAHHSPEYPLPLAPYADAIFTEIQHLNELMLDPVLQLIPGWVEETEARIEELLFELRRGTALEEDLIAGTKEREEKQAGRTAQKDARREGEVVGLKWV